MKKRILAVLLCSCLIMSANMLQSVSYAESSETKTSTATKKKKQTPLKDMIDFDFIDDSSETTTFKVRYFDGKGGEKQIAKSLDFFGDSKWFKPIVMLDDTTALLGYKSIYKQGDKKAENLPLDFAKFYSAALSPDKTKIAYFVELPKGDNPTSSGQMAIVYYSIADKKTTVVKKMKEPKLPFLSLMVDWGDNNHLYFDDIQNNKLTIQEYNLATGTITKFMSDAIEPQISDDNKTKSWVQVVGYSDTAMEWTEKTVIQTPTLKKSFSGHNNLGYAENGNIFIIDRYLDTLRKLDGKTLQVLETRQSVESVGWAEIEGSTLYYYIHLSVAEYHSTSNLFGPNSPTISTRYMRERFE